MKKILNNKRGQLAIPIISFTLVVILFLFIAPFILKIFNSVVNPLTPILGNQSSEAGSALTTITDGFQKWWDIAIMLAFAINIILLLVSAFLVDTHPAFLIIFIVAGFFTLIFAPMMLQGVEKIWGSSDFVNENNQLPMTGFLLDNFGLIIVGVMVLGGVVLYARMKGGRVV